MKITKFRVTNFRSVEDSGWIETDNVTALIGTNESGKTNLLMPLWKLKPAKNGEINAIADYPRKRYNEIRSMDKKPIFIEAEFELSDELAAQVAQITGADPKDVKTALVKRDLGGKYQMSFTNASPLRHVAKADVVQLLGDARTELSDMSPAAKAEEEIKGTILSTLDAAIEIAQQEQENIYAGILKSVQSKLATVDLEKSPKRSTIAPRYGQLTDELDEVLARISQPAAQDNEEARKLVLSKIPSFVYYSNYGNLDSETYSGLHLH